MNCNRNPIIFSVIIILSFLFFCFDNSIIKLVILFLIDILGVSYFKLNLFYPFVWLSPFILIYNVSFFILDLLGVRTGSHINSILTITFFSIISFYIFCVCFIPNISNGVIIRNTHISRRFYSYIVLIYKILCVLLLLYIPYFLKSGFTSKTDMSLSGGLIGYGLISKSYLFFFICYLVYKIRILKDFPWCYCMTNCIMTLSISLFIGERELFFSVIFCSTVTYNYFRGISKRNLIFGSLSVLLLIPILGMLKQITNISNLSVNDVNFIETIFQGEFLSSGRNIETLLSHKYNWDYQYGASLIGDMGRTIIPKSIVEFNNATTWFNDNFNSRASTGFGLGFSYLGEGYLQAGILGVIIWTILLCLIIRYLYLNARLTIFKFTIYIFIIPAYIYAMRGDFSYIVSPILKQVLPICIILLCIDDKKSVSLQV